MIENVADVLTIVMCAVMCRMTELCEIMVFSVEFLSVVREHWKIMHWIYPAKSFILLMLFPLKIYETPVIDE